MKFHGEEMGLNLQFALVQVTTKISLASDGFLHFMSHFESYNIFKPDLVGCQNSNKLVP